MFSNVAKRNTLFLIAKEKRINIYFNCFSSKPWKLEKKNINTFLLKGFIYNKA
jgi:hypothetical protein